ncbi:hypothetical protein L3073_07630 [Ancylomarina sp. DW003]|nr:hypothetical protein [Ancylomarina sp. DW003]MDE5422077.1 hypothetical protein [Ancylomarina sp. DW003]
MEKIQLYRSKKLTVRFLVIGGIFFFILGSVDLIRSLIDGFKMKFPDGDFMSVLYMLMGILYCIWGYKERRKSRYFISWDNKHLEYLSPKSKELVSLDLSDIKTIGLFRKKRILGLEIETRGGVRYIDFEYLEWKELKRMKKLVRDLNHQINS